MEGLGATAEIITRTVYDHKDEPIAKHVGATLRLSDAAMAQLGITQDNWLARMAAPSS